MFGETVLSDTSQSSNQWSNPPDYYEVQEAHLDVGKLEAQIDILEIQIKEKELPIKREKPRSPALYETESIELRKELAQVNAKLKVARAKLKFYEYRKEMFKSMVFYHK